MAKKNLEEVSGTELKQFLDSFDDVLCDCDGVLWNESGTTSGVKETLKALTDLGKNIKFVTNNTLHSLSNFHKKICGVYPADIEDVITPTIAMIEHLKQKDIDKKIYIIGSTQMKQEFINAGFEIQDFNSKISENYYGLINILESCENQVGAVVVDYDLNMSYAALVKAAVYLQEPDVLFITGATETSVRLYGKFIIGPGYFQDILEDLTGRKSTNFGKPDLELNNYLQMRFKIKDPSRTLFIGDTLEQDMRFATKCGYQKLLVLTGRTTLKEMVGTLPGELAPDFYMSSLGDFHKLISLHLT